MRLRERLRRGLRPGPPPPPWDGDLVGETELRRIEARRAEVSRAVRATRDALDAGLADEVEAIRRERERGHRG
jgi:hypothetical protein